MIINTTNSSNRMASSSGGGANKSLKFRYTRPEFLQLRTDDEISVSADHQIRPIILPRDVSRLPWRSGYAECINAGKSLRNEDQAAYHQDVAIKISTNTETNNIKDNIPWTYFGIFDGHAGSAVAVAAASQLHYIIAEKLNQVADLLILLEFDQEDETDEDFVDCTSSSTPTDNNNSEKSRLCQEEKNNNIDGSDKKVNDQTVELATPVDESSPSLASSIPTDKQQSSIENDTNDLKKNDVDMDRSNEAATEIKTSNSSESLLGLTSKSSNNSGQSDQKKTTVTCQDIQGDRKQSKSNIAELQQPPGGTSATTQTRSNQQRPIMSLPILPILQNPSLLDIYRNNITVNSLITGALESAFWEMDSLIATDKHEFKMAGGCTAIIGIFILGKLYVCNAGDSRAIVYKNDRVVPMSFDFTPTSEKERILRLGLQRPEFLGNEFTHLEFAKRPTRRDLGKQMLYRDAYMTGWSMKTITYDDLKFPLVWGEGKRSRVLATIGVTRGFGDHELRAQYGSVLIKPFLTPEPEVKVLPLEDDDSLTPEDVLIIGTDGLWDVTSNEEAAEIVKNSFDLFSDNEESRSKYRYLTAAQDLVIHSRGHTTDWNNIWRTNGDRYASLDDIAVFVIPLKQYKDEYLEWKKLRLEAVRKTSETGSNKKALYEFARINSNDSRTDISLDDENASS